MKYTKEEHAQYMDIYHEALEEAVSVLDKQERYFMELIAFAATHRYEDIPEKHQKALPVARKSVPWRADASILKLNKKSARLFAQNTIIRARNAKLGAYADANSALRGRNGK